MINRRAQSNQAGGFIAYGNVDPGVRKTAMKRDKERNGQHNVSNIAQLND
jgi:hypothetical protein